MDNIVRGVLSSMLDGSRTIFLLIYWICGSNTLCSASSARQQDVFGGRNFRKLTFDRENRENFCLAKISCYTVYLAAAQAIYYFAFRPQGIRSSVEFCDALCAYKLGAAKYGERVGTTNQPQ